MSARPSDGALSTPADAVTASVAVLCPREHAFHVFTERLLDWWPLEERSVGGRRRIEEVLVEPVEGGRVFERWRDGEEHDWAKVVRYEPPCVLALSWRPPPAAVPTDLTVRFDESEPGCSQVTVEHGGFERLGEHGARQREEHEDGWPSLLSRFATAATDPALHRTLAIRSNQLVWRILGDDSRTGEDELQMVHAAHTSAHHWYAVGGPAQQTRAEWLCSRVYAVIGAAEAALLHARTAQAIVEEHPRAVADYDVAYAAEAIARAYAVGGRPDEAIRWRRKAEQLLRSVADDDDRAILASDLADGPWDPLTG